MSDATFDITDGRVPFQQICRALGYVDPRPAVLWLDRLGVPFIVIHRQRFYRPADIHAALDRHTKPAERATAPA
jgi:hypothetical protein